MGMRRSIAGLALISATGSCSPINHDLEVAEPEPFFDEKPTPETAEERKNRECSELMDQWKRSYELNHCPSNDRLVEGEDELLIQGEESRGMVSACLDKDFKSLEELRVACKKAADCTYFFTASVSPRGYRQWDCESVDTVPAWTCIDDPSNKLTTSCRPLDAVKIAEEKRLKEEKEKLEARRKQDFEDHRQAVKNIIARQSESDLYWMDVCAYARGFPLTMFIQVGPEGCLDEKEVDREAEKIKKQRNQARLP